MEKIRTAIDVKNAIDDFKINKVIKELENFDLKNKGFRTWLFFRNKSIERQRFYFSFSFRKDGTFFNSFTYYV